MATLVFDIETGPLPWEQIQPFYEPPPAVSPWSDDMVKYGQMKDPAKRQEKYDQVKAEYLKRLAAEEQARDAHKCEFASRVALSPLTGRVLAIGFRKGNTVIVLGEDPEDSEAVILEQFWSLYKKYKADNGKMVGWNIYGFDLPFLMKRSWFHNVEVPTSIRNSGRYFDGAVLVDLMQTWCSGGNDRYEKLDTAARFLGAGGKPDGVDGGRFAALWNSGDAASRQAAVEYLHNDLAMTWKLAERMGVIVL